MSHNFDIVIVGAGPAGSAAAFTAAEQGASVLLIEEHPTIGVPVVCAEGITRGSIRRYLTIRPEWVAATISGSYVRSPDGEEFKIEHPDAGYILDRKTFDRALAQMAEERGAVMKTSAKAIGIEGNEVIVVESGERRRYRYRFLIGADGIASRVGQWMGMSTRLNIDEILVCAQYFVENINVEPQYTTLIFGDLYAPGGYAWIFPKSDHSANIGVGISPFKTKQKAKYFLDTWIRREFAHGTIRAKTFGGVPATLMQRFSGKEFFLIGDAARLSDPLSGAGIANGIKSGVIAGRNAVLRLKGRKSFFEEEMKREILNTIKFHLGLKRGLMKFTNREFNQFCRVCRRIYGQKPIESIDMHHLARSIVLSSPRILWIAVSVMISRSS